MADFIDLILISLATQICNHNHPELKKAALNSYTSALIHLHVLKKIKLLHAESGDIFISAELQISQRGRYCDQGGSPLN